MLTLETQLYVPPYRNTPEWRPTVAEVIATSTRQSFVQKQMNLSQGLTLADVADRLTLEQLRTLANDRRLTVCG